MAQFGFVGPLAERLFPLAEHLHGMGAEIIQMPAQSQARAVYAGLRNFPVDIPLAANQLQVKALNLEQFANRDRLCKLRYNAFSRRGRLFLFNRFN